MNSWKVDLAVKKIPTLKDPILIEGLPGIGNVGKVALDFIISELRARKLLSFTSYSFPHSVFVNEQNLVELPTIDLYYKRLKNSRHDLLLLAGDVQPLDEEGCYEFSEKVLDVFQNFHGKEVVTLGGVATRKVPKDPKVFCTGNARDIVESYKRGTDAEGRLYGVVGPIVGVSGVLIGLAGKRKINAVSLLAETYYHPLHIGVKGSREILKILNKKLGLNVKLHSLEKEIVELERELSGKARNLLELHRMSVSKLKKDPDEDVRYIG